MKSYNPVTRTEVRDLKQPIVAIFVIIPTTDILGYRLLYNNEAFYETLVSDPYDETYFYDPLTTYRVLEKRHYSRSAEINRSIARKVTIDTFNFLTTQLSSKNFQIYLEGLSVVLNIPQSPNSQSVILQELKKLNQGIKYKESFYDLPYIINPGLDVRPQRLPSPKASPSIPSIPRRIIPPIPR